MVDRNEWIPYDWKSKNGVYPKEKQKCLVFKKATGYITTAIFTNYVGTVCGLNFNHGFYNYNPECGVYEVLGVTHWMPLPDPPRD